METIEIKWLILWIIELDPQRRRDVCIRAVPPGAGERKNLIDEQNAGHHRWRNRRTRDGRWRCRHATMGWCCKNMKRSHAQDKKSAAQYHRKPHTTTPYMITVPRQFLS